MLIVIIHVKAHALGLTTAYLAGFSQFELQTLHTPQERAVSALLGYGHSHWWNPSVIVQQLTEPGKEQYEAGLGNIVSWTSSEGAFSLQPGFYKTEESEIWHLCSELSVNHGEFTPYIKVSLQRESANSVTGTSLGVVWHGSAWADVLVQGEMEQGQYQSMVTGLNVKWFDGLELSSEFRLPAKGSDVQVGLGLISSRIY